MSFAFMKKYYVIFKIPMEILHSGYWFIKYLRPDPRFRNIEVNKEEYTWLVH